MNFAEEIEFALKENKKLTLRYASGDEICIHGHAEIDKEKLWVKSKTPETSVIDYHSGKELSKVSPETIMVIYNLNLVESISISENSND